MEIDLELAMPTYSGGLGMLAGDTIRSAAGLNVLITSHQALLTQEALNEIARVTTENLLRIDGMEFLSGTRLA